MPFRCPLVHAGAAALLLVSPVSLAAQAGPRLGHEAAGLRRPVAVESPSVARPNLRLPRRTQWVKGGVIGATILGVGSFLLAAAFVTYGASDEPTIGDYLAPTLLGGAAGFTMGALIGAQFTKD